MIIAESTEQMELEKDRLTTLMRVYRITREEVTSRISLHYNSVCRALNKKERYWNQDVINLVEQMIEEKRNPVPVNQ